MKPKNILQIASLVLFIAIAVPASAIVPGASSTNATAKTEDSRTQQLLQRLGEIKDMDKSELTRSEKKSLRKEVRDIRKEMKAGNGGVYLSIGAIIIIILLLILIL